MWSHALGYVRSTNVHIPKREWRSLPQQPLTPKRVSARNEAWVTLLIHIGIVACLTLSRSHVVTPAVVCKSHPSRSQHFTGLSPSTGSSTLSSSSFMMVPEPFTGEDSSTAKHWVTCSQHFDQLWASIKHGNAHTLLKKNVNTKPKADLAVMELSIKDSSRNFHSKSIYKWERLRWAAALNPQLSVNTHIYTRSLLIMCSVPSWPQSRFFTCTAVCHPHCTDEKRKHREGCWLF